MTTRWFTGGLGGEVVEELETRVVILDVDARDDHSRARVLDEGASRSR